MIVNGELYEFETNNDFIKKVRSDMPIELEFKITLVDKASKSTLDIDQLENLFKLGGAEGLSAYYPTITVVVFKDLFARKNIDCYFYGNQDYVVDKVVIPFVNDLHVLLAVNGIIPTYKDMYRYNKIQNKEDVVSFINFTKYYLDNIFETLNFNKKDFKELLIKAYTKLGYLASRVNTLVQLHNPDMIIEDDDKLLGVFRHTFGTVYCYPYGLNKK